MPVRKLEGHFQGCQQKVQEEKKCFSVTAREACSEVAGSAPEPPLVDFSVCSSRLLCPAWMSAMQNVC